MSLPALPAIPDSFEWVQDTWGTALRCIPLQAIAAHRFTTRQLPLSSSGDWQSLAAAVGAADIQTLTQVHGADVVVIRSLRQPRPQADTMMSA